MKIYGFITVRTSSSRLPRKALLKIQGKRVIEHVIERAKANLGLAGVVVCTTVEPEDDVLEQIAEDRGVLCYRGSLKDKLARYEGAARFFGADAVLLLDADDLFVDPEVNGLAVKQMLAEPVDMIKAPDGLVPGAFDFLISVSALYKVCRIKDTDDTEMYETYFLEPGRFKVCDLEEVDPIFFNDRLRLTLDYQEDFDFFQRVFDELKIERNTVPLRQILQLIRNKPEIAEINIFRHKDYLARREMMRLNTRTKSI